MQAAMKKISCIPDETTITPKSCNTCDVKSHEFLIRTKFCFVKVRQKSLKVVLIYKPDTVK